MGTVTTAGVTVAALVHASSEEHVSAASINANRRNAKPPFWSGTNAVLRKEPTWGDVDVLMRIVQRLQPGNHSQIAAAVSTVSSAVKAVQLLRNGTAHHNHQTMSEIQGLRSAYLVFPIGHPVHALFWTVPSNGAYLFSHVVDELRFAAKSASA